MIEAAHAGRTRLTESLRRRGTYRRWVLVTALVGMFATTFPVTILTVSLADIAADFEASETLLTWVISAPMLASAVALPVLGRMGDLHGQRKVFLAGFASATVVAALTAFSWHPVMLIALRTVTQVIGAATQPTSMALIMRAFPKEERVQAMGWWSLVGAGAPSLGLIVGGPLVELVGWRFVFFAQAALAVVPVVVAWLILEEARGATAGTRFDVTGSITMAFAAGGLMLALTQSADWGWTHPAVVGGLAVAPLAGVLFVNVERRTTYPLLPLHLLGRRNFTAPLVTQFFAGSTYMGGFVMTPILMRSVFDWPLSAVAFLMLLRPLTYSLSSPIGGRIGRTWGERPTAITGVTMLGAAMAGYAAGSWMQAVPFIAAALVVQGIGNGMFRPSLGAILANAVHDDDLGIASASQRMVHQIGNAFGIAVLTAVYGGVATPDSFGRVYVVALGLGLVAIVATTRVAAQRPVDTLAPRLT